MKTTLLDFSNDIHYSHRYYAYFKRNDRCINRLNHNKLGFTRHCMTNDILCRFIYKIHQLSHPHVYCACTWTYQILEKFHYFLNKKMLHFVWFQTKKSFFVKQNISCSFKIKFETNKSKYIKTVYQIQKFIDVNVKCDWIILFQSSINIIILYKLYCNMNL